MAYELDIKYLDGVVYVHIEGQINYQVALEGWQQVIAVCKEQHCFNILGVQSMNPMSTMDAYNHQELFREVGVTLDYRIAWVESDPAAFEVLKFTEDVLINRGMIVGKVFTNVEDAKQWMEENRR